MSVGFANAVATGLRYNAVPVSFEPGWETRGNGYAFPGGQPQGLITHHTGSGYGAGLAILINGRPDLDGPLCNCCTYPDGRIHIIAAHPANHAGASGGRSMGPLPVTRLFNSRVWGNEVMYPGTQPWTAAQYRSARVLAGVICGILGVSVEHARAHAETSITGKWDPGKGEGPGVTFPMDRFRAEVWAALHAVHSEEDNSMQNISIRGTGRTVLICPTGEASALNRQVWLSAAALDLRGPGWIQVYAQGSAGGVNEWRWTEADLAPGPHNLLRRPWRELENRTTHLVVSWDLSKATEGGTLCLETRTRT